MITCKNQTVKANYLKESCISLKKYFSLLVSINQTPSTLEKKIDSDFFPWYTLESLGFRMTKYLNTLELSTFKIFLQGTLALD